MQFEGRTDATDGRHHMQAEIEQLLIINLFLGILIMKHSLVGENERERQKKCLP